MVEVVGVMVQISQEKFIILTRRGQDSGNSDVIVETARGLGYGKAVLGNRT